MSTYTAKTEGTRYVGVVKILEIREGDLMHLQLSGETWQLTSQAAGVGWYIVNGIPMPPEEFETLKNS